VFNLNKTHDNELFNFVYTNRENNQMIDGVGQLLMDVWANINGGILVFFSSYGYL